MLGKLVRVRPPPKFSSKVKRFQHSLLASCNEMKILVEPADVETIGC